MRVESKEVKEKRSDGGTKRKTAAKIKRNLCILKLRKQNE
jgi:hypothetical protein